MVGDGKGRVGGEGKGRVLEGMGRSVRKGLGMIEKEVALLSMVPHWNYTKK